MAESWLRRYSKKTFGSKDVGIEEVFAEVDFPENLEDTPTTDSVKSLGSTRKVLKYGDWAGMFGEERKKLQQPPQQTQIGAFVATQVHNWDRGQQPRPIDYDHDPTGNDHDHNHNHDHDDGQTNDDSNDKETAQIDKALKQEDAMARKELGKRHPINQQTEDNARQHDDKTGPDPLQKRDPWAKERQKLQAELTNKDYVIEQLNDRLIKLETTMTAKHTVETTHTAKQTVEQTPMTKNIYTPPVRGSAINAKDLESIRKGTYNNNEPTNTGRFITHDGILQNNGQSLSENSTPYAAREIGSVYNLANGGQPGGDPSWNPTGDDGQGDDDRGGRNGYYREFILVSPNKVVIQTFQEHTYKVSHICPLTNPSES